MEKDNIQKELFNEFDAPRKKPKGFGQFFQKTDFAVSLSPEKLVFVSIGMTMLLVVSFALGVERGKVISGNIIQADAPVAQAPAKQVVQVKAPVAVTNIAPKEKTQANIAKTVSGPVPVQVKNLADKSKPYTIVAATFSKEVYAAKEAAQLKGNGFEAFVLKSEPYYLACVGSFANKDSAQKILNKVKQMHRDAYIRLR